MPANVFGEVAKERDDWQPEPDEMLLMREEVFNEALSLMEESQHADDFHQVWYVWISHSNCGQLLFQILP